MITPEIILETGTPSPADRKSFTFPARNAEVHAYHTVQPGQFFAVDIDPNSPLSPSQPGKTLQLLHYMNRGQYFQRAYGKRFAIRVNDDQIRIYRVA
jgi:hypothetical protein